MKPTSSPRSVPDPSPAAPAGDAGPPGVLCPRCGKGRIRLTLEAFLASSEVCCGWCGLKLQIDRSSCARLLPQLQELQRTTSALDRLRERYAAPGATPAPARRDR
jgi:predicted amidophosphoribosyltransferase